MRMTLGAAVVVLVCGVATAAPPRGPLSEGREPDPVVRDYYHGEPPAPPAGREAPASKPKVSARGIWETVGEWLAGVAVPLGPLHDKGM